VTSRFEPLDVEVRSPTIVLSVRLDEHTAKQLHRWAKQRGVRVSDVLREAAVHYVKLGPHQSEVSYRVTGVAANIGLGVSAVTTEAPKEARDATRHQDVPSVRTALALSGA
jgi:hypothetical protein